MDPFGGRIMTDDPRDPHSGSRLRLHSKAATAPPDADAIADPHAREQPDQPKTILLVARDRQKDIERAEEEAKRIASELATSRVERRELGRTGTGLVVEEVRIVDPAVEALRELPDQLRFVQEHLGRVVDMGDEPYDEESSALITVALMECTDSLSGRDIAVVTRVLRGHTEPEPVILRAAVRSIAQAHERWELKRLAEEANAPQPAPEQMDDVDLDEWVLADAIKDYDERVDDGQIPSTHPGAPPPAPLLNEEERDALDEVIRSPSPAARHRARQKTAAAQTAPAEKPNKQNKASARERVASIHALWITACLLLALVAVVAVYLMRQDGRIVAASQERDAKQDETLAEHTASIRSHARTLARILPELKEKDVKILVLTDERDNYAQLAVDSQDSISALDKRVGGQVGSLARDLADTRAELRRKVEDQAHQIDELRVRLEQDEAGANGDTTPTP